MNKIYTGVGVLLAYAGVSLYLNSPGRPPLLPSRHEPPAASHACRRDGFRTDDGTVAAADE